jgi:hypothetical protein
MDYSSPLHAVVFGVVAIGTAEGIMYFRMTRDYVRAIAAGAAAAFGLGLLKETGDYMFDVDILGVTVLGSEQLRDVASNSIGIAAGASFDAIRYRTRKSAELVSSLYEK